MIFVIYLIPECLFDTNRNGICVQTEIITHTQHIAEHRANKTKTRTKKNKRIMNVIH